MVRASDNASPCPGLCTGRNNRAQSMKVFGVGDDWWRGMSSIWENNGDLASQTTALRPAGESGTTDGFCHPAVAVFLILYQAMQHSKLQTASFMWAHPSYSNKPPSISERWMRNPFCFAHLQHCVLSSVHTSFGLCILPPPLWVMVQKVFGITAPQVYVKYG